MRRYSGWACDECPHFYDTRPLDNNCRNPQHRKPTKMRQIEVTPTKDVEGLVAALRSADRALMEARNGLDLGLGCAREVEDDLSPIPTQPRSIRQDRYLRNARKAHAEVRSALATFEEGQG